MYKNIGFDEGRPHKITIKLYSDCQFWKLSRAGDNILASWCPDPSGQVSSAWAGETGSIASDCLA